MEIADASSFGRRVFFGELEARFAGKRYEPRESAVVTSCHRQTGHAAARIALRRLALCVGVLVANFVATMSPAGAQAGSQALAYPLTVYVQASDARFDSYSYSKNNVFPDHASEDLEEFFLYSASEIKGKRKGILRLAAAIPGDHQRRHLRGKCPGKDSAG